MASLRDLWERGRQPAYTCVSKQYPGTRFVVPLDSVRGAKYEVFKAPSSKAQRSTAVSLGHGQMMNVLCNIFASGVGGGFGLEGQRPVGVLSS